MFGWLWRWLSGPETGDGFGQSFVDDLRFSARFRGCRRRAVVWKTPSPHEAAMVEQHPIAGRFGDGTIAVADVDDERWIVRDRIWFGWPDPPEFAFFVLTGEGVRVAADFDVQQWPDTWIPPSIEERLRHRLRYPY